MISAIVGGILAMLYVLLAGMKEIAWLNLLNAILMYAALIVVFICLCFKLPGGWDQVEATMTASADTSWDDKHLRKQSTDHRICNSVRTWCYHVPWYGTDRLSAGSNRKKQS